jgi:ABC-type dipeptide/oligopeptide/nickel transport system permease subunit
MNQQLSGIIKAIRFLRSTLAVVALVFILLFLGFVILLFCPLDPIIKYALIGVFIILGILVWCSFWRKAREEPLTVSETYWIAALPYLYGSDKSTKTREEELELPKETGKAGLSPPTLPRLPEKEDE